MAYTNIWDDTKPTGSEPANTIDDLMRSMKVDIEQRFNDMFAMPSFATDPLRLYGLKFTDAQDSIINLGDNTGVARTLSIKNKTGATTYFSINSVLFFVNIPSSLTTLQTSGIAGFGLAPIANNAVAVQGATSDNTSNIFLGKNSGGITKFAVDSTGAITGSTASLTLNQNATTSLIVTNTDVTNATSRAELRVVGGAISGIFSSIATDALYIGATTNSIVRFISNGAEKFRLDTSGIVTFQNAINILTGGLTITAGNTIVPNIKTTGASGVATVNNTLLTIVSFASAVKGIYMFTATADTLGGAANCTTFIGVDGSGNIVKFGEFTANANTGFSVSGTNIQYKQSSGGSLNITWTYTLLA